MWWMVLGLAAVVLIIRSEYEKKNFVTERTEIVTDKVRSDCRIVFLSDLHNNEFGRGNERLIRAVDQVKPDLVLVGGDMMICKGKPGVEIPLSLLGRLSERYPVCCGNGNHETRMDREREVYGDQYDFYVESLEKMGAVVLRDSSFLFREDIRVTGIDLEEKCYRKFSAPALTAGEVEEKAGPSDGERFQILLCHSPLFFGACREWGADLTLAGHFHGGTVRLPVLGGVMTPQYQFFLPWCAGEFERDGRFLEVSRGLGTHSINIRLNDRPQLLVVDVKRKL